MYEDGHTRPPGRRRVINALLGLLALLVPLGLAVGVVALLPDGGRSPRPSPPATSSGAVSRDHVVESIFQDDDHLLYSATPVVIRTLDTLRGLGVDRLRLTILWRAIAPAPDSARAPRGFAATLPGSYPTAVWAPYDRIVRLAAARGIGVDFNLTAPGPRWAMAPPSRGVPARYADHARPSALAFGQFVAAVGRRYSGTFPAPAAGGGSARLPRVAYWTIWNEPNQPGWLAPQRAVAGARPVPVAPALYRGLVDSAYGALAQTGHTVDRDTILIGETAPEGSEASGAESALPPMTFLRALYCVDDRYRPLAGAQARSFGCPLIGGAAGFVRAHPGLFRVTGFAHHPYSFFLAPKVSLPDPNFVPISDLGRLESGLDRVMGAYAQNVRLPLYLTEYGYETFPPNPFRGVSLRLQSLYLNQAQYLAWRDPRVRATAQFLLYDALPNPAFPKGSPGYWSTFQTGLRLASGTPKPSLNAYRIPIFLPSGRPATGLATVWGMLRLAPNGTRQHAMVQWRPPHGRYRTLASVATSDPSGFLRTQVRLPGPGAVRIAWTAPDGRFYRSRGAGVR